MNETRTAPKMLTVDAPAWLPRDTYAGKWQTTRTPGTVTVGWLPAREMAERHADGAPFIMWEYSGITHTGRWLFSRSRFVATPDGRLVGYTSDGSTIIIHPADRIVRYLGSSK
jgi:hypothetical protein